MPDIAMELHGSLHPSITRVVNHRASASDARAHDSLADALADDCADACADEPCARRCTGGCVLA